ncbi:MAG: RNA polymerase sigma factor [Tannerellaceae bacterium]|jgi:RNA polymerase sigma-70 factor (ECF subfamily)|nr:RNA polymerase sigma factor [Tannerellaceae bacterium]
MEETIDKLIEKCRRGNRYAQLALYERYARKLYMACLRIVGNAPEAEEAMQDSFLKVFIRLDQYQDGQCFEAWIHRIAIHTAIDYVRRHTQEWEELSSNYAEPAEEETGDDADTAYTVAQIKEAAKKLPAGYRVVLSLYLFEGYDMEEISSILHIKPASVRTQYMRAKRKLFDLITANEYVSY